MQNYEDVFRELLRVLVPGGRAVFVEPGANHSKSPETIRFLKENPKPDWWLEKDVNMMEIHQLTKNLGFKDFRVKPFLFQYVRLKPRL